MFEYDCAINGAGMVGATTALALADLGLKVVLIDKAPVANFSPEQPFDLRISAISLSSQSFLAQLGAWQQLTQWRVCPYKRLGVWETDASYTEFNSDDINQPQLGYFVENRLLQLSLWQGIEQHSNITLLCPETLHSFRYVSRAENNSPEQLSDNSTDNELNSNTEYVELTLSDKKINVKLLIAADGANSTVRKLANIGCTGWNYEQSAMLIHVTTENSQQDITWQQFYETGPVAMLPLPGNNASLVWYNSRAEIKRLSELSHEALTTEVMKSFPPRLGKVTVVDKGAFNLTRSHANQYVKGKVVLLGDAAHSINPLAGQGVNLGFKDVKALQLCLASAMGAGKDWAASDVLANYEKARRADNLLMMTAMDSLNKTFSHPSVLLKGLRNLGLMAVNKVPNVKNKALAYACGL